MGKDLKGKELGKGISQRKNGVYEARFTDRFGNRKCIYDSNLKTLKKKYIEAVYEDEQETSIRDNIKLNNWYEKWMKIHKFDAIRGSTKAAYGQIFRDHISPTLGDFYLKDITQLQIKELLNNLKKNGFGYETRNKVRIILIDMYNKALIDEFVKHNPAKNIHIEREEKSEPKVLSKKDQADFFDCCKGTFYDNLFTVAVNTGMRIGELAGLKWSDIDWDKNVICVRRTLNYKKYDGDSGKTFHVENPKTRTSIREIPINKICSLALKKQYIQKCIVSEKQPPTKKVDEEFKDFLFTTKFDTPLNDQIVYDAIKKIVLEINLMRTEHDAMEMFSSHCFRHTFATRCFEAGIKPKTVQKYLGHASLQMTMDLYTSVLNEYMDEEMKNLDESLAELEGYGDKVAENTFTNLLKQEDKILAYRIV